MKNKEYSLQLLTHKSEIFATREDAIEYFEVNFRPNSLIGEPALAFYGDQKSPKAIMAIGVADKKVFYIDTNKLSESIDDVISKTEDEEVEITNSLDLIKNIITACGLTLDENKKTNRVTYDTDVKDDVIGNAKSLSEAINLLSKFIQKGFKDNELKVDDTESIKLSYKPDATDGKKLTAEVKLSNNGDSDDTDFNDNIICKKSDGLYAAANLEYDEEKHTLTFTSSGYKDGKYKDDAHKKVINLDEHTIVSTENHHHNIELVINKIAGTNKYVISGDVRLSEDENNILKIEDDHLIVDGRAKNIKYGDITVAKGLNNLKDRCDDLADKIDNIKDSLSIDGTTTDTFEANVVKGTHGFTVSGNVRLSNDTSVKVSDGGLSVNVDIDVDTASNQLTLKVGNRTKIVSLPGIQIVKNIRYDEKTASIIIELTDSSTPLTIPVSDMIETIYVQNDASSAVELHKHEKEGEPGRSYLSATVKLKTSGNILAKDPVTGELYVPETAVSNAVAVETNRALEAERTITEKVNTVSSSITDEVERAKEAERVLSETDNTIKNEITSVKNNLETEKTARESFDNNIKTIVDGHTQSLSDINSSLDDAKSKITDETSARELADTTLQSSIDANKTAVDKEVVRAKEAETAIASNVAEHIKAFDAYKEKTDSKIADLTQSDNDIKSLIADKVADINNEISATNTKVTKLEGDTSKLSTDVNDEVTRAKAAELTLSQGIASNLSTINDEINRSTNKDTELENKISSHIEAYIEYKTDNNAKVSVLQNAVKAIETDVSKKYNDLDAKDNQIISDYKAADVTLQSNIDKEVARATTEEGKINSALTDEVARAKAKETELLDKVNSLDSDYKAADTQLQSTIDGLTTDLTNEVNRATEAENKIKSDLTVEINKKVASVTIEKNSTSDLQYTLYVDGKPSGEVNIPKDQLLTNVEYLAGEKIIRFTFETTNGVKVTDVNVADLVDTYIAGDGLTLEDNKFSVKKSDGSQSYLEVTSDGVKIVGIDEALALKANAADIYTKDEIEAKGYLTEHQDVSSFVTKDELSEVKAKTDANTSAVTDEVTRAKDAESNLNVAIKANETSITNEVTRATNAETAISDKLNEHLADVKEYKKSVDTAIDGLRGADTAINEKIATNLSDTKASIESVKTDYKASDVTLQSNIDKEAVRATTEEGKINSALTDEVARAKAKETELSDMVNSLDSDYKAADTQLKSTIDGLTTDLTNEVNRATEAENKIKSDLTVEINKKVASVTIEKNSTSDLQYTLYVDGKPSGEVNIPKDQLLSNVEYLAGEKIIRFTFETTSGVKVTDVNVADLVDTYIAGDGLTLVDNKFSVKKSDGSQSYLEVTSDGVKIVGIDEALALKANAANVYTKDEIEAKGYLTEHQDVSSFVTKDELSEVKTKTDANTSAVTDEVTRAKDAESNLNVAIKANETSITNEVTRATNAEKVISDKLNEHLADVKEYKKSVDTAIDGLRGADTAINEKIATNLSDTKASIESVKTDYKASDVTLQSNIDKETVRATTEEGKINSALTDEVARAKAKETELKVSVDANSDAITKETERAKVKETELLDTIKDNAIKASFVVNKSNTINLTKETKDDGSSVLTGNVEISTLDGNLLKNDQPLYASVDLTYDAGTNTLKFNSSALETEKVIKLNAGSVIDRMYYDAETEELVIVYTNANGEQSEVRFSARTLFNKWDVQKEHLGGIILNKQVNKEGTDILSGTVVLSTLSTNALINDQGSLYVSNQAKDYNLADGKTVQLAIEELQKKVDDGGGNKELNDRLTECESQVTELVSNDNQQDAKLTSLETDVENLKKKPSLKVANTNSVAMAVNEDTITSEIRLASGDNLIRVNEDGLSFDGSIDYGIY